MPAAYVTFRYADHEYIATVRNVRQLISYVAGEDRPFAISNIEFHGLTTSEEQRIREACWNSELSPSFDQSLLDRPEGIGTDTLIGPEAHVKRACCDIVNGCLQEVNEGLDLSDRSLSPSPYLAQETVDDMYDGYDYTDGFGLHCVLEHRSDGLWALHTIRKHAPAK